MSGYWAKNIDGFQWLYYNYGKIINEIRSKQKKNPGAAGAATVIASVDDRD
jgi:hypothetical protein